MTVYIRDPLVGDIILQSRNTVELSSCLSKGMPFYDRTIDVVSQNGNFKSLPDIRNRYRLGTVVDSKYKSGNITYSTESSYVLIKHPSGNIFIITGNKIPIADLSRDIKRLNMIVINATMEETSQSILRKYIGQRNVEIIQVDKFFTTDLLDTQ